MGLRAVAAALLVAAAVVATTGCGGRSNAEGEVLQTRYRFLPEDPQGPPPRDELFAGETVFDLRLDERGSCLPIWPAGDAARYLAVGDASYPLEQMDERVRVTMDWPEPTSGPFPMARVDRLEVELLSRHPTSTRTGDVAVYWAGRGEKLDNRRSLLEGHGLLGDDGRRHYGLSVGVQAGWTGEPRRVRLIFVPPTTGEPVSLCGIRGIDEALREGELGPWLVAGWKGTLGGQIRNALPALPGEPIRRLVEIPESAELRLGYGAPGGVRGDLEMEVRAGPPGGDGELLASWSLAEGVGREVWHDVVVDLSQWAGREVELSLRVVTAVELDPARGLPLWGNPEIVAPR